jgi:flagellar hook-length control protein FliK
MNPIANAVVPQAPTGGTALDATATDAPAAHQEGGGKPFQDALGAAMQAAAGEPAKPDNPGAKPVEGQNLAIDGNGLPLLTPVVGQQELAETACLTVGVTQLSSSAQPSATLPVLVAPPAGSDGDQPAEATVPTLTSGKPVLATVPMPVQSRESTSAHPSAASADRSPTPVIRDAVSDMESFRAELITQTTETRLNGSPLPERAGMSADTPGMANLATVATAGASSSTPARAPVETTSIPVPLASSRWGEALGERVVWMTNNQIQTAQIQINPPNLGPLEVRVTLDQGQASVQFSSTHGDVRDAVQAALPRLRDMFGEAGVTLLDIDVSARSFAQQRQDSRASNGSSFGTGAAGGEDGGHADGAALPGPVARGLVDLYA